MTFPSGPRHGCGNRASSTRLNVLIVLKTTEGGAWAVPQAEELRRRGHSVAFLLPEGEGKLTRRLTAQGFPIIASAFPFTFGLRLSTATGLWALRRQIREFAPDVLVYHLYASALAARLASWGLDIPRVHMVAGPLYLESRLIRAVESVLVRSDDLLIAGSEYTRRAYEALPGRGARRTTMIPYGVDVTGRQPATAERRSAARAARGYGEEDFVVVLVAYVYSPKPFLGQEIGLKGHDVLLKAWEGFLADVDADAAAARPVDTGANTAAGAAPPAARRPRPRLVLVGSGFDEAGEAYRGVLKETYAQIDAEWVDTVSDVSEVYHAADLSVSPSLSENHGAAMEAGAYGVASIVSSAGGLPEMVTPDSGWVVAPGDVDELRETLGEAYEEFLRRPDGLGARGAAARRHIESRYTYDTVMPEFADQVHKTARIEPTLTIFTEAHYVRDYLGRTLAVDGVNGDTQWARYCAGHTRPTIVGRLHCAAAGDTPGGDLVTVADVAGLPEYSGARGTLLAVPRIFARAVGVARSSDIVIGRLPGMVGTLAAVAARLTRTPFAAELVGDAAETLSVQSGLAARGAEAFGALTRWATRGAVAARYVTTRILQERYPATSSRRLAASNVRLDDALFLPPRTVPVSGQPLRLLVIGTQHNLYKGHDVALRAFAEVRRRGVDATLTLLGDGREQPVLRELAEQLGVTTHATFAGAVPRDEVLRYLDRSDLLLQPSRTEGLPRTVVEAAARAVPTVGTRAGGIPELVAPDNLVDVDDVTGLAEAIIALATDPTGAYAEASSFAVSVAEDYRASELDRRFATWRSWLYGLAGYPAADAVTPSSTPATPPDTAPAFHGKESTS